MVDYRGNVRRRSQVALADEQLRADGPSSFPEGGLGVLPLSVVSKEGGSVQRK
jgi:hypothetical protein